ncbi:MAG: hypothetical protein IJ560_00935 [Alphaproteobacteria bacterium]|nr:hypothetical protein [Alphaproteobacteria bacterium]
MKYPDDFNTNVFPAGRRIAISRFMAIGTMVVFALMVVACVVVVWTMRSVSVRPCIISVDSRTGNWNTITDDGGVNGVAVLSPEYAVQQSLVGRFAVDWMTISETQSKNADLWRKCDRARDCVPDGTVIYGNGACAIYCASGDELYNTFVNDVIPEYSARALGGDAWRIVYNTLKVIPLSEPTRNGGTWQVYATVRSAIHGDIQVVAYVRVARNTEYYWQTLGFYVSEFNAYRIN